MSEKNKAATVDSILGQLFRQRNWHYRLDINRVFLFWTELVGAEIAQVAQPDVIRGDTLWLKVVDSAWLQQLHFLKLDLLEKINRRLQQECGKTRSEMKQPQLADIRFKIAAENITTGNESQKAEQRQKSIDPQRQHDFDLLIKSIKDIELRERIRRLWLNLEKRLD